MPALRTPALVAAACWSLAGCAEQLPSTMTASDLAPFSPPGVVMCAKTIDTTDSTARRSASPRPACATPSDQVCRTGTWMAAFASYVEAHKFYPQRAAEQRQQGNVTLRLLIKRDGYVLRACVAHSSGFPILDLAFLSMFQDRRMPPFQAPTSASDPLSFNHGPPLKREAKTKDWVTVNATMHYTLN